MLFLSRKSGETIFIDEGITVVGKTSVEHHDATAEFPTGHSASRADEARPTSSAGSVIQPVTGTDL